MLQEGQRIDFLIQRDGLAAARTWVARTLTIYCAAINNDRGYASRPPYRPLFEQSIRVFEAWLKKAHAGNTIKSERQ
jgi:hypothetical protein